ncbi:MAG: SRPBCC family protein, partial [Acidobacteriota bacterium]
MIAAPTEDVWRALTDPRIIQEWSGAVAEFPLQVGATYS